MSDPHDVASLLEKLASRGATASIWADEDNVADFVWLGDAALRELDEQAERLAAAVPPPRRRKLTFHHAAYVQEDSSLVVVGQMGHGAFVFTVVAGGWGWCRPLA